MAPLPTMPTSSVLLNSSAAIAAPMTPPAAPRLVTTATWPKIAPVAATVEPALKPNQPTQRIRTARPNSGML